jgi:hypothetical protein
MQYFLVLLELHKCDKFLQIKIILCWTIISFICALISQHNVRLEHKNHHLLQNLNENYFPNPTMMHETKKILKMSNYDKFSCTP